MELRQQALAVLLIADPPTKAAATRTLFDRLGEAELDVDSNATLSCTHTLPGRPARPRLVPPKEVPSRSARTLAGRAALLHAIAHIEFNAINLALDAVWRFARMPASFYSDWLQVAAEEALHFTLLSKHLHTLGFTYGDFEAHDGLWQMCERTQGDIVARMALVPRVLEARGLDATPLLQEKFRQAGDAAAVDILSTILRDEVGHVAIGNRWYHWLCVQRGLDPGTHDRLLIQRYAPPTPRPPFNLEARQAAGFTIEELDFLQQRH